MKGKGWCIAEAGAPDSQTLGEEANCKDVVKASKKYHSDREQMADLLCSAVQEMR